MTLPVICCQPTVKSVKMRQIAGIVNNLKYDHLSGGRRSRQAPGCAFTMMIVNHYPRHPSTFVVLKIAPRSSSQLSSSNASAPLI